VAPRLGLRAHLQSDGRRRHGGDLSCQVWQWVKHGSKLTDGRTVTSEMSVKYRRINRQPESENGLANSTKPAKSSAHDTGADFTEFLTLAAYSSLTKGLSYPVRLAG